MAVNLKTLLDTGKKVLVIIDLQVRMHAALHQDARSAERNRFFDLLVNHMVGQDVGLTITLHAVERAKCAELFAHIRVIDIAIDDVADDIVRMETRAYPISCAGKIQKIRFFKQPDSLIRRDSSAFRSGVQYRVDASHINSRPRGPLIAPILAAFS